MGTKTLQQTMNWAQAFLNFAQLAIGTQFEPALSSADTVAQTIVGPPFVWPWNRQKTTFQITAGIQDYLVAIPTHGYLEVGSVQPAVALTNTSLIGNVATYTTLTAHGFAVGQLVSVFNSSNSAIFNVSFKPITAVTTFTFNVAITNANIASAADTGTVVNNITTTPFPMQISVEALTEGTEQGRPHSVAIHLDDGSGNFTVRFLPIPEQTYLAVLTSQKTVTAFGSPANTWPLPDKYEYIYNYGFLFLMFDFFDDPRAQRYRTLFLATLLAAAEGLTEFEKNLFLGNWLTTGAETQAKGAKTAQGVQGRGQ